MSLPPPPNAPAAPLPTARTPEQVAEDAALVKFVRGKHAELMAHLSATLPGDRRVQTVQALLTDVTELSPEESNEASGKYSGLRVSGRYNRRTGLLRVLPRNAAGPVQRPHALAIYLHELAHCIDWANAGLAHGDSWRATYKWLLNIATQPPLNWDVKMRCSFCDTYRICSTAECAKCKFMCKPKQPGISQLNEKPRGVSRFGPPSYTRVCVNQTRTWPWWKQLCVNMGAEVVKDADLYTLKCQPKPLPAWPKACATLAQRGYGPAAAADVAAARAALKRPVARPPAKTPVPRPAKTPMPRPPTRTPAARRPGPAKPAGTPVRSAETGVVYLNSLL